MGKRHWKHGETRRGALGMLALTVLTACTTAPEAPPGAPLRTEAAPALVVATVPASSPPLRAIPAVAPPLMFAEPAPQRPPSEPALAPDAPLRELQRGRASWYGPRFQGRRTANGERYDMHALTAAHKTLPFGTVVRVRSLRTGREVDVRINDRGPYRPDYVIDVSRSAAQALGLLERGVQDVLLLASSATPTQTGIGVNPPETTVSTARRLRRMKMRRMPPK